MWICDDVSSEGELTPLIRYAWGLYAGAMLGTREDPHDTLETIGDYAAENFRMRLLHPDHTTHWLWRRPTRMFNRKGWDDCRLRWMTRYKRIPPKRLFWAANFLTKHREEFAYFIHREAPWLCYHERNLADLADIR